MLLPDGQITFWAGAVQLQRSGDLAKIYDSIF